MNPDDDLNDGTGLLRWGLTLDPRLTITRDLVDGYHDAEADIDVLALLIVAVRDLESLIRGLPDPAPTEDPEDGLIE